MIEFPKFDPVILKVGPLQLRWYGLAYIVGIVGAVWFFRGPLKDRLKLSTDQLYALLTAIMIGTLLGGRIGYILIYDLKFYLQNPGQLIAIWQGGMAYHGAAIGLVAAFCYFAWRHKVDAWDLLDLLGMGSTIGIFFGRIANFINGELYGRMTKVPWGVVFPSGGPFPRHPSQLYEAFFEGAVLFIILFTIYKTMAFKRGQLFAFYLVFYGVFRFGIEFFREPDHQLGLLAASLSMGQLLCLAMIAGGGILWWFHQRRSIRSPLART